MWVVDLLIVGLLLVRPSSERDAAYDLVLGPFAAVLRLPLPVHQPAGHSDLAALLEMLRASLGALAERRDIDEERWLALVVVDSEPQITDAAAIRQPSGTQGPRSAGQPA
jgi:hypothetical protein